jgi:N,N-dimethylformamidase beta subunit-like protein
MARKGIALSTLVVGLVFAGFVFPGRPAAAADNPIVTENQQPGTSAWQLANTADDLNGQIKGYADSTSVMQGSSLNFYVSVNPAQTFTIDVYRLGYYGGLGGRLISHAGPLDGTTQAPCVPDPSTGMIACGWTSSYTFAVGTSWTSGFYMVKLINAAGYQNYVPLVVRDGRPAAFLYQSAVTTAQAANNYPNDQRTGKSLYEWNSYGANTVAGTPRAVKLSFDRPYSGDGSGQLLAWEMQLVRWLESKGYDVTYSTDVDTHANGAELLRHKAFFSAGHDEYWSKEMYDAAETARDAGVNLAFFGANDVYWQVRFEASAGGTANRVMVSYKDGNIDPVQGPTTTLLWRDPPVNRPEQSLIGVMFTSEVSWGNNVPYVTTNSGQWAYAGTGLKDGDSVPGLVGTEMDRLMSNYPPPTAISQTLLSNSPFVNSGGAADYANSSLYQAPSKAWVFATGTSSWSWALDNTWTNVQTDPRIQQMTATILNAFITGQPLVKDLKLTVPATATAGQAFSVAVMAEDDAGNPVPTYTGTVHFSSSDTAAGVILPADSTLVNGQGTFSATLIRAGSQSLTVSDAASTFSTTASLTTSAAPASTLVLASGATTAPAGSSVPFTVRAQDPYGNTSTGYAGTVHFTTTDPAPGALPQNSPLSNGQGSFNATLDTAGSQRIIATDTASNSISGSLTIQVTPLAASRLVLAAPAKAVANQPFNVTVTLKDRFGNVATSYAGTVYFSSSDLLAMQLGKMPADYRFTGQDAGIHTFSSTLLTPPSQTITVADTANASLSATSPAIAVGAM